MLATIVDTTDLWHTVAAALVASVGVTLTVSLVILGVARFADRARDGRSLAAAGAGAVASAGLVLTIVVIVLGMTAMLAK